MASLCSAPVCKCNFRNVNFPDLWKFAWSDDPVVAAKYNVAKLVFGIYWTLYTLYNMISAMQSDEFRNKHFWYLSNWGLYISTAYLLGSGIVGTFQYGYLLQDGARLHVEQEEGLEMTATQTSLTPMVVTAGPNATSSIAPSEAPADEKSESVESDNQEPTNAASSEATTAVAQEQHAEQSAAADNSQPQGSDAGATDCVEEDSTAPANSEDTNDASDDVVADAAGADGDSGEAVLSSQTSPSDIDVESQRQVAKADSDEEATPEPLPGAAAPYAAPVPSPSDSAAAGALDSYRQPEDAGSELEVGLPLQPPMTEQQRWPSCSASCTTRTATQPTVLPVAKPFPHCNPTQSFWVHATLIFLFELAFALGVAITLIYWTLLFNVDDAERSTDLYRSVQTHVTILIPVVESVLSRVPFSSTHFPAMFCVGLFYIFVNGMYTAGNPGESLYSILTWEDAGAAMPVLIGVLLLAVVSFWGGRACTRTRDLLAERSRRQKLLK